MHACAEFVGVMPISRPAGAEGRDDEDERREKRKEDLCEKGPAGAPLVPE